VKLRLSAIVLIVIFLNNCDRIYYVALNGEKDKDVHTFCGVVKMNLHRALTHSTTYQYRINIDGFYGKVLLNDFIIQVNEESLDYRIWYNNEYTEKSQLNIDESASITLEFTVPDSFGEVKSFSIAAPTLLISENATCGIGPFSFQNKIIK